MLITIPNWVVLLLPPATKLGQGNIFRSMSQEFCPGGVHGSGGVCMCGMHGRGEVCEAGGHVWQILRDMVNERVACILL